ncbi:MAG: hypothetical protein KIT20_04620 [Alphaproteobacteria bacterium]|nr:hypothetical protein [Alphaproteobacteria bacterium]
MTREILFEFRQIGSSLRVAALDAESGLEVTLVGPAGAGEEALKRLAIRKLEYVRRKKSSAGRTGEGRKAGSE